MTVMTPAEKESLRDLALELMLAKLRTLTGVQCHLAAAAQQCRDWRKGMNTFEDDAEIYELGQQLEAFLRRLPRYDDMIFAALTQREVVVTAKTCELDSVDILRLRQKEADLSDDDDDHPYDKLPHDDPFTIFMRLREK